MSSDETRDDSSRSEHPDPQLLRDCALGRLDDQLSRSIEQHLESCDACCRRLIADDGETVDLTDTFLSLVRHSAVRSPAPPALRMQPGYELLDEIGRGGMAVVYRARQLSLDRIVALKRIRSGESAERLELLRFRREAEAVSRLVHPAIVQVFDAGEQQGQPYMAMEYMSGGTLASALAAAPLQFRDAARLLKILASAIHHAHCHQLVHRDLKPANVLLTVGPSAGVEIAACGPKIADFGLAKRFDDLAHTRTGVLIGTPGYMAPEQISSSHTIGPAADIYALGAVLYECLAGRPPFRGATALETLDQVRTLDPVPPSRVRPGCPRDLETICLKCLQRSPARRYTTAGELEDDLTRFLEGRPITARRTSWPERAAKWAVRRPMLTALLAVITLALTALSSGGWVASQWLRTSLAQRTKAQLKAERHLRAARDAWNQNWNISVEALADVPGTAPLRLRLLENAEREYGKLLASDPEHVETRLAFAMLLMTKADVLASEHPEQAGPVYQQALARIDELCAERPGDSDAREAAEMVRCHFGWHLNQQSRWPEAETVLLGAAKNMHALVDAQGQTPRRAARLAEIYDFLAQSCGRQGKGSLADQYRQQALDLAQSAIKGGQPKLEIARAAASVFHNRALQTEDDKQRGDLLLRALELLEHIVAGNRRSRADRSALANVCISLGTLGGGQERIAQARELFAELSRQFPGDTSALDGLARCDYNLAGMRLAGREFAAAEQLLDKALATRSRIAELQPGDDDNELRTAETLNHRGLVRAALGRSADAEADYRRAFSMQQTLVSRHAGEPLYEFSPVATLVNFSELLRTTGRAAEALPLADQAVTICQATEAAGIKNIQLPAQSLAAHGTRALTLQALGRTGESVDDWNQIVALADESAKFGYRMQRALALAAALRHADASAAARELVDQAEPSNVDLYNLACVHGLAAKAVHHDPDLDEAAQTALEADYVARAMELIARLKSTGYLADEANRRYLEADPDLERVRLSKEFAELMELAAP